MTLLIIILLVLLFIGGCGWGYPRYGWGAPGLLGVVLIVALILLLFRGW